MPKILRRDTVDTGVRLSIVSQRFAGSAYFLGEGRGVKKFSQNTEHCEYRIACPARAVVKSLSSRGDTSGNGNRLVKTTLVCHPLAVKRRLSISRGTAYAGHNKRSGVVPVERGWVETLYVC